MQRSLFFGALAAIMMLSMTQVISASSQAANEVTTDLALGDGAVWYEYGTGATHQRTPVTGDAFVDTVIDAGDVVLAPFIDGAALPDPTVPWWDDAWSARHCASVSGAGIAVIQHRFDSTTPAPWAASGHVQADYGDVRAVAWDGTTNAAVPFWLATPADTDTGRAFLEMDFTTAATQTVCLYFGHSSGGLTSSSDPSLGQTWGTKRAVYERVNPRSSSTIAVSNPTAISVLVSTNPSGTTGTTIAPGGVATIQMGTDVTLYATGSVIVRGTNTTASDESLTPTFHLGTRFLSATQRLTQRWCFTGPAGTSITIDPTASSPTIFFLDPTSPCRTADSNRTTVITSGAPVGAFHVTLNGIDQHVLYPATTEPLFGVPSERLLIAATGATDVRVDRSGGSTATYALPLVQSYIAFPGANGTAEAARVTTLSGTAIGAAQQGDADGGDSTSLLPISAMAARYVTPLASTYVAITCPVPGQIIHVAGVPQTCAGTNVGKLRLGATPAGTTIESPNGAAFMVVYEPGTDESNMFIPRFSWADSSSVSPSLQSLTAPIGTWTAAVTQATDTWGLFTATTSTPAGTSVTWEVACAPTSTGPFSYSTLTPGDPLPHECDDHDAVSIRSTLRRTSVETPRVTAIGVEHTLVMASPSLSLAVDVSDGERRWAWRIHDPSRFGEFASLIETRTQSSTGTYVTTLVDEQMNDARSVVATSPTAADTGTGTPRVHRSSIRVDVTTAPNAPDEVVWSTIGSMRSERSIIVR